MIRACIFDLDGTLLNTLTTIAHYGNASLKAFGLPAVAEERYRYLVGNGAKILVERMIAESGGDPALYDAIFAHYNAAYDAAPKHLTQPYPGVVSVISELKQRGIFTAVLSNKPHFATVSAVGSFFEPGMFDRVYGQREGIPIKPNPLALQSILDELGVLPSECLYIGDTAVDMQTGKAAGIQTVGVLWGFRTREELVQSGADVLLERAEQLLDLLD